MTELKPASSGLALALISCLLVGCSSLSSIGDGSTSSSRPAVDPFESREDRERREGGTLFGEGGIFGGSLFGGGEEDLSNVNKFLWQASMETTRVLPIRQADFRRGVIETQWYAPPGINNEQMRLVVLVAPGKLTRNGIRVNAFRRTAGTGGQTVETPVDPRTILALEEAILNRARQIRLEEEFG